MLELAIAEALHERYPDFAEGRLTRIRSQVVSRQSCAQVARELDIGVRLLERGLALGGEGADELSRNRRILAAALEAALAAVFLEYGFATAGPAIAGAFAERIEHAIVSPVDHKTRLQEMLGKTGSRATYAVLEVDGPPHDRTFLCAVLVDGEEAGRGSGRSKKDAEQVAAAEALAALESAE